MEYLDLIREKLIRPATVRFRYNDIQIAFDNGDTATAKLDNHLKFFLIQMKTKTICKYFGNDCVREKSTEFFKLFGYKVGDQLLITDDQGISFKIVL